MAAPAPLIQPPPPVSLDHSKGPAARSLARGLVRDIRAEAQNIQQAINDIQQKGTLTDTAVREAAIKASVADAEALLAGNRDRVNTLFDGLHTLMQTSAELYDNVGDSITNIENSWERVCHRWPTHDQGVEEILVRSQQVGRNLEEIIFLSGLVTIPKRVNDHLAQLRPGQSLDFHKTFADEMAKPEDRVKVLEFIHTHPVLVEGVTDVQAGLIYSASRRPGRRRLSYLLITVVALAGVGLAYGAAWVAREMQIDQWPTGGALAKAYAALLLGSITHILINGVKQARAQSGQSFLAIDDWLIWVHIKELAIMASIVSLWIALLGLGYLRKVDVGTAFFVGYSIDSFVDLFLERFTSAASAKTQAITAEIKKLA
ncbi:MAG TPA: hypothetical protein VKA60_20230 [Blastocatellia bacterium]|nr:hypothetical protein [Blastocatellia bacterium]